MGISKKLASVGQRARGRKVMRFEIEVIPYFAGEIPADVEKALFAWERGSKIFLTEAEQVNQSTHAVFWKQFLKQTVSLYRDGDEMVKKDCVFKIQSVGGKGGSSAERKTIGKLTINLAQFCTGIPEPQEMFLQLKPHGKLKVSIKATWLQNSEVDMDAMTEVSGSQFYSGRSKSSWRHDHSDREDEQDLSGFPEEPSTSGRGGDDEEGGDAAHRRRRREQRRRQRRRDGVQSVGEGEEGAEVEEGIGSSVARSPFSASQYQNVSQEADEGEPKDSEEVRRKNREDRAAARKALKDKEYNTLVQDMKKQESMEMGQQLKVSWMYYWCCCGRSKRLMPKVDPEEGKGLLTAKQQSTMKRENMVY